MRNREYNELNVKFYKANCENLDEMTKIMVGTDILCHAAAYAHEGLSNVSPNLICQNNVVGSTSVFTAAIRNHVKRIVFVLLWPDMEKLKHLLKKIMIQNQ